MYCNACGTLIPDSSKFCQNCGHEIISKEIKSNNSNKQSQNNEEFIFANFLKNTKVKLYLLYVILNISLLLIFSDNILGEKYENNIFWPFGEISLGNYDITEFLFYTIVPPLIFYFWGIQIKDFSTVLRSRIKNAPKRDYQNLQKALIYSLLTSLFLSFMYFGSSEVGKFDFKWIAFLSAVIIGGFVWLLFFGLLALIWYSLKLSLQNIRGQNHSFTFSDWFCTWATCSFYVGTITVLANLFLNK